MAWPWLPAAGTGAGADATPRTAAALLPPHDQADDDGDYEHDDDRPERADVPDEADKAPDLVPDEKPDDPMRQAASAERLNAASRPGGDHTEGIHDSTMPPRLPWPE